MDTRNQGSARLILVTGASGYVGGRLVPALEAKGERVRCLARTPDYLKGRFSPATEIVRGDVLDPPSLHTALKGVHTAYYLVHSMGSRADFRERDRVCAHRFARAARRHGVRRIIYLGGLAGTAGERGTVGPMGSRPHRHRLPAHMASRHEVGGILASHGPPTVEFRASIIIGSGSLSFELIRSLVNRLPVMVTPRWVRTSAQPIAIGDVVAYLVQGLGVEAVRPVVFEIGGPQRVTYGELMQEYARQIGVRRVMIPVPLLSPRLSSLWLGLVTPLYARVGRKLIDSMRNESVVNEPAARERFPVRPLGAGAAIAEALREEDREMARTRWSDAVSSGVGQPRRGREGSRWGGRRFGSRLVDRQQAVIPAATPARAFGPIQRIGGKRGWYFGNGLWMLRGLVDLALGGVGMRRGRRHPVDIRPGDPLDFWRVEAFEAGRLLRLRAEMKVPGRAWLQFEVRPTKRGSRITQTAVFDPLGLWGLVYWYGLYPVHWLIFRGMLKGIAREANAGDQDAAAVRGDRLVPRPADSRTATPAPGK
ncbi:MAG: SDR family oxidoreductase [Gemmatimonadota bacterium]|nr:SDR family oxidoreductase [Gemmatimonadota bacterium]